eukprot:2433322-Amphidinium_carterae.1
MEKLENGKRPSLEKIPLLYVLFFFPTLVASYFPRFRGALRMVAVEEQIETCLPQAGILSVIPVEDCRHFRSNVRR